MNSERFLPSLILLVALGSSPVAAGPFEDALDGGAGTYETNPPASEAPWTVAGDIVQSGIVGVGEDSILRLDGIDGPGVVSFFWAVSAEILNGDDSLTAASLSSSRIGPIATVFVPDEVRIANAANQSVFFSYNQNVAPAGTPGILNRAFLDQVYFVPQPKRTAPSPVASDRKGEAVAAAGNLVLVGARNDDGGRGAAYLYDTTDPTAPVRQATLVGDDVTGLESFGSSTAICGDLALIGAVDEGFGAAYLFDVSDPTNPVRKGKLTPGATEEVFFGKSVALSGNHALVSASHEAGGGTVFLYDVSDPVNPVELAEFSGGDVAPGDLFGHCVSLSDDLAIVGAPDQNTGRGAAYIFALDDPSSPRETSKLDMPGLNEFDLFGVSVSISGSRALVGSGRAEAAWLYDVADPSNPQEIAVLTDAGGESGDSFGVSVGLSGDFAIVGAFEDDDDSIISEDSGSAVLFDLSDPANPRQRSKLTAFDLGPGDWFGQSVAISGNRGAVGAPLDDLGGGQEDAGSAYFPSMPWVEDLTEALPVTIALPASGGTYPLRINAIGAWNASSDSAFASLGSESGTGNGSIEITVAANPSTSAREATVTVDGVEHTITQAGFNPPAPVISAPSGVKAKKKGKITARVASELPVSMSAKATGGAKVKVAGGNPFKVIVKKLKKKVTRVTLVATDSLGRDGVTVVKVKRK